MFHTAFYAVVSWCITELLLFNYALNSHVITNSDTVIIYANR